MAAADTINTLYELILGRSADAAGLAAAVAAVNAGVPLATIAVTLALSPEAQYDINALYQNELGRPVDPVTLDADITYLANGGSLALIRTVLATSAEATLAVDRIFQALAESTANFDNSYQTSLANGGTLASVSASVAASNRAQPFIQAAFGEILNRAPSAAELASATAFAANGGTAFVEAPVPSIGFAGSPLSNTLVESLVNTSEVINDINAAYQTATGHAADPVQIASAQSELQSGFNLASVLTEIGVPAANPLRYAYIDAAGITPQTIGGSPGSFAYPLQKTDALISPNPNIVDQIGIGDAPYFGFRVSSYPVEITGFNTVTDVIQIPTSQTYPPNTASTINLSFVGPQLTGTEISGVGVYQDGSTALVVPSNGAAINLLNTSISSLTAANFRIVS